MALDGEGIFGAVGLRRSVAVPNPGATPFAAVMRRAVRCPICSWATGASPPAPALTKVIAGRAYLRPALQHDYPSCSATLSCPVRKTMTPSGPSIQYPPSNCRVVRQ